ncbi:MAG: hypothetical protein RL007_1961 [Bacteroidota bacterium]|jgi:uncharacterized protein (DUF2062 family)
MIALTAWLNFIFGFAVFISGLFSIIYGRFTGFPALFVLVFFTIVGFGLMRFIYQSKQLVLEHRQSGRWKKESLAYFRERELHEQTTRSFGLIIASAVVMLFVAFLMLVGSAISIILLFDSDFDMNIKATVAVNVFLIYPFTFSLIYYCTWTFRAVAFIRKYVPR